ncbi:MAG TPA: mercury resistance system periplasmic binding protein MerP [Pyrinomonadaceae bacterium]
MKLVSALLTSALVLFQCSASYAATKTATLAVSNMDCVACPITVKKALSRVEGVSGVSVSFEKKEATVTFDDTKTTVQALTQTTADVGFPSSARDDSAK